MIDYLCVKCSNRLQATVAIPGGAIRCPVCGYAMIAQTPTSPLTAIATPEDAAEARVALPTAASDGAFSEGLPPYQPVATPSIRNDVSRILPRWAPFVIVGVIVLILVGLMVPAVARVREAAARTQSTHNLKNIGLAAHSFHDANKRLPFNGSAVEVKGVPYFLNAKGGAFTSGSWGFQLTAFEQSSVFTDGIANYGFAHYMCPGRGRPSTTSTPGAGSDTPPWSDYVINPWLNDAKGGGGITMTSAVEDNRRTLVGITDGTSNTIFFGHGQINTADYTTTIATPGYMNTFLVGGTTATALSSNPAAGPVTFARDSAETRRDAARGWGSPFSQGCLMCMCDATVRVFPYSIGVGDFKDGMATSKTSLAAYLTPSGGEVVTLCDN